MLVPGSFQTPFAGGLRESECPRCHKEADLPFGSICPACKLEIEKRARRIARIVSLVSTAAVGLYIHLNLPEDQVARMVGAVSAVLWYVFSYQAAKRAAGLLLK